MEHAILGSDVLGGQLAVGMLVSLLNIGTHATMMAVLSWITTWAEFGVTSWRRTPRRMAVMMASVSTLMLAHCLEVFIWGWTYYLTHAVNVHTDSFYFAFVNYTTLGYGDILPVHDWRMLGPFAAMNGILLFGWSTAVMYDILRHVDVIPVRKKAGAA